MNNTKSTKYLLGITLLNELSKNRSGSTDRISLIVPLAEQAVLQLKGEKIITSVNVKDILKRNFGLSFPKEIAYILLKKLSEKGVLKERKHDQFEVINILSATEFNTMTKNCEQDINDFVDSYIDFKSSHCNQNITKENASSELLSFFEYLDIEYSQDSENESCGENSTDISIYKKQSMDVAKFITIINKNRNKNPELLNLFYKFANGVASQVALCFFKKKEETKGQNVNTSFRGLTIYLDTLIILNLLGLYGPEEKEAVEEFITNIKSLNGRVAIFSHTKHEIENILYTSKKNFYDNNYIPVFSFVHYFKRIGKDTTDIEIEQATFENTLRDKFNISIIDPPSATKEFELDKIRLKDLLLEENKKLYHNKSEYDQNIIYDIDSIIAIHNLRQGKVHQNYEGSQAIFVTTNDPLVLAAKDCHKEYHDNRTARILLAVKYHWLVIYIWSQTGFTSDKLSETQSLSLARSIINFSDGEMSKILEKAKELAKEKSITESEYLNLRKAWYQDRISIMDNILDKQNEEEIIRTKLKELEKLDKMKMSEHKREVSSKNNKIAEKDNELERKKEEIEKTKQENQELQKKLDNIEKDKQRKATQFRNIFKWTKRIFLLISGIVGILKIIEFLMKLQ